MVCVCVCVLGVEYEFMDYSVEPLYFGLSMLGKPLYCGRPKLQLCCIVSTFVIKEISKLGHFLMSVIKKFHSTSDL